MFLSATTAAAQDSSVIGEQSGFAYSKTTFSSQQEMLDFIKSLDFDKNPPAKRLSDFYNDEMKITNDKVLRKGIDLYQKGKIEKAVNYYKKILRNYKKHSFAQLGYAEYQIIHYNCFGVMDIYFNGIPSRIDRVNTTEGEHYYTPNLFYSIYAGMFLMADPKLRSYDPIKILSFLTDDTEECYRTSQLTQEFLAAILHEAFPKNGKPKIKIDWLAQFPFGTFEYKVDSKSSTVSRTESFCEQINQFFNYMDCLHLIARTTSNLNEYYGIGLTADELYKEAKRLNPNKQIDLLDYNKGIQNMTENDERCKILLLRSAYYGNQDAMFELFLYIIQAVQLGESIPQKWHKGYKDEKEIWINNNILDDLRVLLGLDYDYYGLSDIRILKDYPYIWEGMSTIIKNADKQLTDIYLNYRDAKEAEERAKKAKRAEFWNNLAGAFLNGLAAGVNTYMATQYYGGTPMNTMTVSPGNYPGSLADAMSQPGYFQREQQRLLQQSMNQVQWAEWQEYNQARAGYQRMGRDLTLDEFRTLQGQAIMNLKEQGYDVIAEQKAINQELHNSNRSLMNSRKENVQRIKEQNDMKYGTMHSASASSSRTTSSTISSTATSSKSQKTTYGNSTNTTGYAANNRDVSTTSASSTVNNAHEQYKSGNLNTNTNSYGDKIKNVSMAVKDGASYRNVSIHGELYKKGSQYFVKIGNTFFKVESAGGTYNSYIIYGAKAHYFNK